MSTLNQKQNFIFALNTFTNLMVISASREMCRGTPLLMPRVTHSEQEQAVFLSLQPLEMVGGAVNAVTGKVSVLQFL